jgi:hypothetical protein
LTSRGQAPHYREARAAQELLKTTDRLATVTPPTTGNDSRDDAPVAGGQADIGGRPPPDRHGTPVAGILAGGSAGLTGWART